MEVENWQSKESSLKIVLKIYPGTKERSSISCSVVLWTPVSESPGRLIKRQSPQLCPDLSDWNIWLNTLKKPVCKSLQVCFRTLHFFNATILLLHFWYVFTIVCRVYTEWNIQILNVTSGVQFIHLTQLNWLHMALTTKNKTWNIFITWEDFPCLFLVPNLCPEMASF